MKENSEKKIPEVAIGVFGHVDHGKTTLVHALTGRRTDVHSEEQKRAMTIRLGYATATFYKCPKCKEYPYTRYETCEKCGSKCEVARTVSFVDAPGHEALMATALAGTALIDGALLIIAANEGIKEQTKEHLLALEIAGIKNIVVVQTKLDLVDEARARKNYEEIREFLKGTIAERAPVIPVAAQQHVNIDALIEAIEKYIPTPQRDENAEPVFFVARSFDINKPGCSPRDLRGGVLGGAVIRGVLKKGDEIEISPGYRTESGWQKLTARIESIRQGNAEVEVARPGGLTGLLTTLDPSLTKSDSLAGNVAGLRGKLPTLREKLVLNVKLVRSVKFSRGEAAMFTCGVTRTVGVIKNIYTKRGDLIFEVELKMPVVVLEGARIAISKRERNSWRLVGYATLEN